MLEDKWSEKDKMVFKKLFEEFNVRTARGRSRREWMERASMELSDVSRTELSRAADLCSNAMTLQTRLRDALKARDRACQEQIEMSRKKFEKLEENFKRRDEIQEALRQAAVGQERRHHVLKKLKEIRVSELERRRVEIDALNRIRYEEASRLVLLEKQRRIQEKALIQEYKANLEQQRLKSEAVAKKRRVEEQKAWSIMYAKNSERVLYRSKLLKDKNKKKQNIQKKKLCYEKQRSKRLMDMKSNVPYFDRIRNLKLDRDRVCSDTKGFAAYKNASDEERQFGTIDGYYDETIWKDVRFKIQSAIRAAGLHQSAVVRRIFQVEVSAPYA